MSTKSIDGEYEVKKGRCYICNDVYSDNGMSRHIKTCLEKEKRAKTNKNNTNDPAFRR